MTSMTGKWKKPIAMVLIPTLVLVVLTSGCEEPFSPSGRDFPDYAREVFVLNDQAETVGVIDADTLTIHSDAALTGSAPNHLLHYDGKLYITNSLSNSILVLDEDTLQPVGSIYLGSGRNPWTIIPVEGSSKAYVPNYLTDTVSVIDLDDYTVDPVEITVGSGPEGGCYLNGYVYICNSANGGSGIGMGSVSVIEVATDTVVATIEIGDGSNPQSAFAYTAADPDEIHVILTGKNGGSESDDGEILILNASTYAELDRLGIGGSPGWSEGAFDAGRGIAYLTGVGGLMSYDPSARTILRDSTDYIVAGTDPETDLYGAAVFDPANDRLVVSDNTHDKIIVIDADPTAAEPYAIIATFDAADGVSDGPLGLFLVTE